MLTDNENLNREPSGDMIPDKVISRLEKENAELRQQLATFQAAMEREKKPDWEKWLKDLADSLETEWDPGKSSCAEAARQLRYMADSFTLKANFVPSELRIKELEQQLETANLCIRGLEGDFDAAEKEHDDLIAKLERYEKALAFYSDPKRWEQCHAVGNVCDSIEDGDPMMVFLDGEDHPWSVADEALKGDK